ncbi:MAG: radical SAM protein [Magnetococcales bacterium]|nr:radical SAM protein [Magnetococcales bacterium]
MNDVALVTYLGHDTELMPVGPLMLATLARQKGLKVEVVDLPPHAEEEALARALAVNRVVGLSTLCTTFHRSLRLAAKIKAINPQVTVVMGGPQASAVAQPLLERHACVDLVFSGEAESGWNAFLDGAPLEQVSGLVYRHQGQVVTTAPAPLLMDLDQLPMPAFDLYRPVGLTVPLETGRGCPFRCVYCSTNHHFQRCFRAKSPSRILGEMDELHGLYGAAVFDLINDSFTTRRSTIQAFCDAMRLHPRRYTWNISARPDQVDERLLELLRGAGCRGIYFGLETGSQRLQKVVRKNLRVERAVGNVLLTRQAGLLATVSFIIGFPDESLEDLTETLRVYGRLKAHSDLVLQLHLLSPLAGSALVASGMPLAFDGMPTDFNDADADNQDPAWSWPPDDVALFPHRYHFRTSLVPRRRHLFVAYVIHVCGWHFPNFLHQLFSRHAEAWIHHLVTAEVPEELVGDRRFPDPAEVWIERIGALCAAFATSVEAPELALVCAYDQAYSQLRHRSGEGSFEVVLPRAWSRRMLGRFLPNDHAGWRETMRYVMSREASGEVTVAPLLNDVQIEERLQAICGSCGRCCLDEDGMVCGADQWNQIAGFLRDHQQLVPETASLGWPGLVRERGVRYLAEPLDGEPSLHDGKDQASRAAGAHGLVRHACAHLRLHNGQFGCAIQQVKPAECVTYPYRPMGDDGDMTWHLELGWSRGCDLTRVLEKEPVFKRQYLAWARARLGGDSGAMELGRLHAREELALKSRA